MRRPKLTEPGMPGIASRNRIRSIVAVTVALLGACATARAAEPLLLAQVASQTNVSSATNSRGMLLGMNAAFDRVNATGGINGRPVRVVNHDDDLNPTRMVDVVTKTVLPDPKVLALVGLVNTGGLTALAKDDTFAKNNLALIAPLQGDRQVVGAGNVFPFRAGYADEVNALVEHAATMGHRQVAVLAFSIAFGPAMAQVAEEAARRRGLEVTVRVVDAAPDSIEQNMAAAAAGLQATMPTAVVMLSAGRFATEMAKAIRASSVRSAQLYALSVVLAENMVKALGPEGARGIIISQAVPFPFQVGLPFVAEYQRAMKVSAPSEPYSFASLEGYAAGSIAIEALRRAGPEPTREKITKALNTAGEINLGGVFVRYSKDKRNGWGKVELTMIGADGRLLR